MPWALELISFFFLGHGPTYPISDLSGSAITRGNCTVKIFRLFINKKLSNRCANQGGRIYFGSVTEALRFGVQEEVKACFFNDDIFLTYFGWENIDQKFLKFTLPLHELQT